MEEGEIEDDKEKETTPKNECPICLVKIKKVVFVPCGHIFCPRCARKIKTCAVCRADVHIKHIFFL